MIHENGQDVALTVCWGAGVDSSGMLIEMARRGIRPDLITMADVGAEKPGTYAFLPLFAEWLVEHDMPAPTICEYKPLPGTSARYRAAAQAVCDRLGLNVSEIQLERLSRLYGNMVANETLPSIAFGHKGCSVKWKIDAQEPT
jgi:hypothetical protein